MRASRSGWFKSSYSGENGACVEARHRAGDGMDLRDSKDHTSPVITFTTHDWSSFTTALKAGQFDSTD
ncbi:DUF397 domain-containing protein [Streptomyces sp. RFCAC02]|uniref:DUF397 domain-containing protein n=1 Tax=Streptomyces sp. RFCAC02 TaxID=2499143 RepID=UPI00101EFEB6|nr:DUF397 domain-containing protein [Streptomyces sp. RFCAC02]